MQLPTPLTALGVLIFAAPTFAQSSTVEGFDGGSDGGFIGNAFFEATGGNPDGNAHHNAQVFFNELRTGGVGEPVNLNFVGDYSTSGTVTFGVDIKVDSLTDFIGNQIARPFGLKLIDRDIVGPSGASGVYIDLAVLSSSAQSSWTGVSATIDDPTSVTLPPGWIGFGDEDPVTFAPILPPGATFASVLASVDEVHLTGATPGFFFNNANYDMRIDNVSMVATSSIGTSYCTANPNSTGVNGETTAIGSTVANGNNVTLGVNNLPSNAFGIFVVSRMRGNQPLDAGVLCLGGAIGRFQAPGQLFQVDPGGSASLAIDLTAIPQPTGTVPVMAGETWNFQAWHRDVTASGGATANFALPIEITFQ